MISIIGVSAKWYEFGGDKPGIFGKLFNSRLFNVTVQMANTNPQVIAIWPTPTIPSPNEGSWRQIRFNVTVFDDNGADEVSEISGAVVKGNLTYYRNDINNPALTGDNIRQVNCWDNDLDTLKTANWTCNTSMHYWDIGNSTNLWNISIEVTDIWGGKGVNASNITSLGNSPVPLAQFRYGLLDAIEISATGLSWTGIQTTTINRPADTPLLNVSNKGNVPIYGKATPYARFIQILPYNLSAVTPSNPDIMWSESFTASNHTSGGVINCNAFGAETLKAGYLHNLTDVNFTRRSSSDLGANASIQMCLENVLPAGIRGDTYFANLSSMSLGGPWMIATLFEG
jgi:hypothetical protein